MTDRTQEPSLTERLAAKLATKLYDVTPFGYQECTDWANNAPTILPLLLSEPELVASLPDEVRLSVLSARERAVMKLGEAYKAERAVWSDGRRDTMNHEVLSDWSHDHTVVVKAVRAALAEVKALTPEGKDG